MGTIAIVSKVVLRVDNDVNKMGPKLTMASMSDDCAFQWKVMNAARGLKAVHRDEDNK